MILRGFSPVMCRQIKPLEPGEVAEVGAFLARGFGLPPGVESVRPEFMTWKFFDPRVESDGPRGYVSRVAGRIVGFIGVCPSTFHVAGEPGREVSTLHLVDWLAEKGQANAGAYLFLRAHRGVDTGYAVGGTDVARRVGGGGGYEKIQDVPVFAKTLRPGHRLRDPGGVGGVIRAVKDLAEAAHRPGISPRNPVTLRRVETFGDEVDANLDACERGIVFTRRRPDLLNHLLRCPNRAISGYWVERGGETLGFGLLSVLPNGRSRVGKVVECFLPGRDLDDWHAAFAALTGELKAKGADFAVSCGSTDWSAEALRRAGYRERYRLEFRLRDKRNRIPRDLPFHLTWIEADYSYLP